MLYLCQDDGETTDITEIITKCSAHEARLLMEHFLSKTIELVIFRYFVVALKFSTLKPTLNTCGFYFLES